MPGLPNIAIAGATGFVGRAWCDTFRDRYRIVGLSRGGREPAPGRGPHEWRQCDLFSLLQVETALVGVDVAVYLVHSMMPTDRLTQASFAELDLILADNFGRAAARQGVRRIVYLGGLIPQSVDSLSRHLASRLEVEAALAAHGVPVTTLRAGLVVGAQGSSFRIVQEAGRAPARDAVPSNAGRKSQADLRHNMDMYQDHSNFFAVRGD
ncbi:MAG: NAD-dependent epimerase/dehydratase family protein, partial [Myxococcota bacterium]